MSKIYVQRKTYGSKDNEFCGNCKHWKGHQKPANGDLGVEVDNSEYTGCDADYSTGTALSCHARCCCGKWEQF